MTFTTDLRAKAEAAVKGHVSNGYVDLQAMVLGANIIALLDMNDRLLDAVEKAETLLKDDWRYAAGSTREYLSRAFLAAEKFKQTGEVG